MLLLSRAARNVARSTVSPLPSLENHLTALVRHDEVPVELHAEAGPSGTSTQPLPSTESSI